MKKLLLLLITTGSLSCMSQSSVKSFSENISKEYTVAANSTLAIYNLLGDVEVQGYEGNTVQIEVKKTITAESQAIVNEGKRDFKLNFDQLLDSLIVYTSYPYDTRPNTRNETRRRIKYKVRLDFTVKVPRSLNLRASTVNNGEMVVMDVSGQLHVNNVNGGIEIKNAKSTTRAHTVNGNVTVNYLDNPSKESSYHTINGDIKIDYKADLSADLTFKSMNGEYFTNFENYELLPSELIANSSKSGRSTKYKVSSRSPIRIGDGGVKLRFSTLNGDVYINKS